MSKPPLMYQGHLGINRTVYSDNETKSAITHLQVCEIAGGNEPKDGQMPGNE